MKQQIYFLVKVNRLTEDIQGKVDRLNSVVDAVKGIGRSVQTLNSSVDRVTNSITHNIYLKMKIKSHKLFNGQMLQWKLQTNGKIDTTVVEVQITKLIM